jgi:transcriptional regulator with XRE-family HTH domain/integrase
MMVCTWTDVLAHIRREHTVKGSSESYTEVSLSVAAKFLKDNGQNRSDPVSIDFIRRLDRAFELNFQAPESSGFVFGKTEDSAYRTRIRALIRAHAAVTGAEFNEVLRDLLQKSNRPEKEIAAEAGISPGYLSQLKFNKCLESVGKKAVPALDKVLSAGGKLISAFSAIAMSERGPTQIIPGIAGQTTFAAALRTARVESLLALPELGRLVDVPYSTLNEWEKGIISPSLERRKSVEQLDKELNCNGRLLEAWLAGKPAKRNLCRQSYRLRSDKWPERLNVQWMAFEDYKTKNTKQLERKNSEAWSPATLRSVRHFVEMVMGWIVSHCGFSVQDVSVLLLCEWSYIKGWLDFTRQRTGNAHYTHAQRAVIAHYRYWLCEYFPFLWEEARADAYWRSRLPQTVSIEIDLAPGVGIKRTQIFALENDKERWAAVVAEAVRKANRFCGSEKFVKGAYTNRAQSFIDSKATLQEIGKTLSGAVNNLPSRIITLRAAVQCRRLAECALLVVRTFRRGTMARMRFEHVTISEGIVNLDCPAEIMKNRQPVKGPLPTVPWLHTIMRRYRNEARPMLIGEHEDSGLFFIGNGGGSVSHHTLYNDAIMVLGVNPHAVRYITATDGHRQGCSDDALAELLGHDPKMTREIYRKIDAEDRNAKANKAASGLIGVAEVSKAKS